MAVAHGAFGGLLGWQPRASKSRLLPSTMAAAMAIRTLRLTADRLGRDRLRLGLDHISSPERRQVMRYAGQHIPRDALPSLGQQVKRGVRPRYDGSKDHDGEP